MQYLDSNAGVWWWDRIAGRCYAVSCPVRRPSSRDRRPPSRRI